MTCPFINICEAHITYEQYQNTCSLAAVHTGCPHYREFAEMKKKPKEWHKMMVKE